MFPIIVLLIAMIGLTALAQSGLVAFITRFKMELSSPRFKGIIVSAGFTFWFFIITSIFGVFTLEYFVIFIAIIFPLMQLFSTKVSSALDIFAIYNTKFFLGILFVTVISLYGVLFRVLGIDLMRTKKQDISYWNEIEKLNRSTFLKEY